METGKLSFKKASTRGVARASGIYKARNIPLNRAFSPYVKLFDNWNFSIDTESAAATLFNAFYLKLMGNTLKDDVGEELWENQLAQSYLYYIPDLLLAKIIEDKELNVIRVDPVKYWRGVNDASIIRTKKGAVVIYSFKHTNKDKKIVAYYNKCGEFRER